MASEKKSVRYQHELKATKEEGVRMLMRLKHMMDAKVIHLKLNSDFLILLHFEVFFEELEVFLCLGLGLVCMILLI